MFFMMIFSPIIVLRLIHRFTLLNDYFAVSLYTSPDDSYAMIIDHELSDEISILINIIQLSDIVP